MSKKLIRSVLMPFKTNTSLYNIEEINRENRMAIHLLAKAGLPLCLVNSLSQLVVTGVSLALFNTVWLLIYSLWLLFVDFVILPEDYPETGKLLYFLESPFMLLSVMLGTVWDPVHPAVTMLLFLIAMPIFILDREDRVLLYFGIWTGFFIVLCCLTKDPSLVKVDIVHALEFYVAAAFITNVVMRIRLVSLQHLQEAEYRLEHNSLTGCLNRYGLTKKSEKYLYTPLTMIYVELDQLKFFNDFYGHETGDALICHFTRVLREQFGDDEVYHSGGDEAMGIMVGVSEEECKRVIGRCEDRLRVFTFQNKEISIRCTFGYVTGTPSTAKEFNEMLQLADIYSHKARNPRMNRVFGGAFARDHLKEGVIEANLSAHARAFEISELTGLPGMSYFVARSNELLKNVVDETLLPVIGYFKIMHLRDYNNEFGFTQGDELIAYTGKLLQRCFENRLIGYITAGQFCLLCYEEEIEPALEQINDILDSFKPGFRIKSKAGFSRYSKGKNAISLLEEARTAHKSIVNKQNVDYCFYGKELDNQARLSQYIVNHVDEAIEKGYLKVYYQPIVRASSGEVCNEEALSRWDDPEIGFLMPYTFIPVLEENGLIWKVSLHVIRQVIRDCQIRKQHGMTVVPVSVNLSRRDFEQCDMVSEISNLVDMAGFSRSLIKIEITESAFTANQELLKNTVDRFRSNGFEVWMDDFGSEYSTLNLLQNMDFDLIKIDMKFMENFSVESRNYVIISNIIGMTKQLGITTLIEGIETREQYEIMEKLGCDKMQGFLFNRPNSLEYIINRFETGTGLKFEHELR